MDAEDFRPWRRYALTPVISDADDRPWRAFESYLVQSPTRNLGRLARERGVPLETIHRWADEGAWVARVRAYDDHLADIRDEVAEDVIETITRGAYAWAKVGIVEAGHLARAQARIDAAGVLRPREAMQAFELGSKTLLLLNGRPTERVETVEQDLSRLSDAELETLRRIQAKLAG